MARRLSFIWCVLTLSVTLARGGWDGWPLADAVTNHLTWSSVLTNYTVHPFQQLVEACDERAQAAGQGRLQIAQTYLIDTNDTSVTITNQWGAQTSGGVDYYAHVRAADVTALVNKIEALAPYFIDYTNHVPWFAQWLDPNLTNVAASAAGYMPLLSKARLLDLDSNGYVTNRTYFADDWPTNDFDDALTFMDGGDGSWTTTAEARNDYALWHSAYFTNAVYAFGFGELTVNGVYIGITPDQTNETIVAYNPTGETLSGSPGSYFLGSDLDYTATALFGTWSAFFGTPPAGTVTNGAGWFGAELGDWRTRYYTGVCPVLRYTTTGSVQAVTATIYGERLIETNQTTEAAVESITASGVDTPSTNLWYSITNVTVSGGSPLAGDQIEIIYTNSATFYNSGPFWAVAAFFDELYDALNRMTRTYAQASVYTNGTARYLWQAGPTNSYAAAISAVQAATPTVDAGGRAEQYTQGSYSVAGATTNYSAEARSQQGRWKVSGLWTNKQADIDLWVYFTVWDKDGNLSDDYPLDAYTTYDQQDSSYAFAEFNLAASSTKAAGTNIWYSPVYGYTNQAANWAAALLAADELHHAGYAQTDTGVRTPLAIIDWSLYFDYYAEP
jgi:hypothetical protein